MQKRERELVTPGQILLNQFLTPLNVSQSKLARDIDVSRSRIAEIIADKRTITADTALRLSYYFKTSPEFWLNMQNSYDLKKEKEKNWDFIQNTIRPMENSTPQH